MHSKEGRENVALDSAGETPGTSGRNATYVLGISAFYHDSAAVLLKNGVIVAAAQEERFSRVKHDSGFPAAAIAYCMACEGLVAGDLSAIAFYDKPLLKFERILETFLHKAPRGYSTFVRAMPIWAKEKLFTREILRRGVGDVSADKKRPSCPIYFPAHHQSHAASAFYPSPFNSAAILCVDGVGEWATTSTWVGSGHTLTPIAEVRFPHSLGLLYSAFTQYLGFEVNDGEYKVMGLAPYGEPVFVDTICDHLVEIREDGSFALNMDYFDFEVGQSTIAQKFCELFGQPARQPGTPLTTFQHNMARSIQDVTHTVMLHMARHLRASTGMANLCLAGGVALNCVANARVASEAGFDAVWVQPSPGDAGGAIGAAQLVWHQHMGYGREPDADAMRGGLLGPHYSAQDIEAVLQVAGVNYRHCEDDALLALAVAALREKKIIGWYQGRMEFGPRALGARTLLADATDPTMKDQINGRIKQRESFRPFAPVVAAQNYAREFSDGFENDYMTAVSQVRHPASWPAITHVDGTARVQSLRSTAYTRQTRLPQLLAAYEAATGRSVLINTSFNLKGEPIVCTPRDALLSFCHCNLDAMAMGPFWIERSGNSSTTMVARLGAPAFAAVAPWRTRMALGAGLLGIAAVTCFFDRWRPVCLSAAALGVLLLLMQVVAPRMAALFELRLQRVLQAIGHLNNRILLSLIYGLIVIPLGLAFRWKSRRATQDQSLWQKPDFGPLDRAF